MQSGGAAQGHVFADCRNDVRDRFANGSPARILRRLESLDIIRSGMKSNLSDISCKRLEIRVAGDKVRLRIEFDGDAVLAANRDGDKPFSCDPAGFLGRLRK